MDDPKSHEAVRRLTWFTGAVLLWGALILIRLISLQVVHHGEYLKIAIRIHTKQIEVPAPRGAIYDRNNQILAMSVPLNSVYVNPLKVPDLAVAADLLGNILGMDRSQLYGRMKWYYDKNRGFMWVKRKISVFEAERLRSLHLDWIQIQEESQRRYPAGTVAAHVLGSVDHGETGNAGIEQALDDELRGEPGTANLLTDVKRRGIDEQTETAARSGTPITLTIHERIQFVAERELARAVEKFQAKSGSVVVMNPYSGEILALASYPAYDPNQPPVSGDNPTARLNHATSVPFEPGSVFKVVTLTAALESTPLGPNSIINCHNGSITLFGRTIHEAHGGFGALPLAMVLAKSSNIGAIEIGMRVGPQNLYDYARRFGFGSRSGVSLPAESGGRVRKLSAWGATSLSSVAMGHEVSVTTMQLARACAVVANGGLLVKPKLILKKGDTPVPSDPPRRVIKPETAITMRQMMEGVVLFGTGRLHARLDGYSSGGKTGTAQIFDFATRRYTHNYNASFMGFAPVPNPAIIVVATVNGSHGNAGMGAGAAAPVFKAVAQEVLRILDVPKDLPEPERKNQPPRPEKIETNDLAIADLTEGPNILVEEAGEEAALSAASGKPAEPAAPPKPAGPTVPDFAGMTMRAVMAEASSRGLPVIVDGSGVVRVQQPPPGSVLRDGEKVRVQFVR